MLVPIAIVCAQVAIGVALAMSLPRLVRDERRLALAQAVIVSLLITAVVFARDPVWILARTQLGNATFLFDATPMAAAFLAALVGRSRWAIAKRAVYLVLIASLSVGWGVDRLWPKHVVGPELWSDDVCLQLDDSACAPAAAATFLRARGVSVTQAQLSRDCLTSRNGTRTSGLFRGLRQHHPQARLTVWRTDRASLTALPCPCVCIVTLTASAQAREPRYSSDWGWKPRQPHVVVLLGVADGTVVIGDPAVGRESWPAETFMELWTGVEIH